MAGQPESGGADSPFHFFRLELGAGGGLVGLGVALELERLGRTANKLLVTDQQEMLHLMRKNINLNQLEAAADALVLNWYSPRSSILASDRH